MERALFVIVALGVNAITMGPWVEDKLAAILRYPAQSIRAIERRLNRPERPLTVRRQRGLLLLLAVLMTALATGLALKRTHWPLLDIILLALLLPVRPTWDRARAIAVALQAGDIADARRALAGTVWRHYALLDDHALARAAIEMLAVHFSEKILAPALWYMVLGMPGFLVVKLLYLLKENLCQPMSAGNAFSQPVSLPHVIINYIPSRIGALLWLPTIAFLPSAGSFAAIEPIARGIIGMDTPEQLSVLAAASVLGLSLGGPTSVYTAGKWLGNGSAKAASGDITRTLYLWGILHALMLALLGMAA